ncbi:DUF3284 domain-containing protein [Streptococcus iniae]
MIIRKEVDVSRNQLFKAISLSLMEDYHQNTLTHLQPEQLREGLTYIKHYGKNNQHNVRVTVTAFEAPKKYPACFSSNRGLKQLSYRLEDLGHQKTAIVYEFEMISEDIFQKANQFLMQILLKKSLQKQTQAQLQALVNYAKTMV